MNIVINMSKIVAQNNKMFKKQGGASDTIKK